MLNEAYIWDRERVCVRYRGDVEAAVTLQSHVATSKTREPMPCAFLALATFF